MSQSRFGACRWLTHNTGENKRKWGANNLHVQHTEIRRCWVQHRRQWINKTRIKARVRFPEITIKTLTEHFRMGNKRKTGLIQIITGKYTYMKMLFVVFVCRLFSLYFRTFKAQWFNTSTSWNPFDLIIEFKEIPGMYHSLSEI